MVISVFWLVVRIKVKTAAFERGGGRRVCAAPPQLNVCVWCDGGHAFDWNKFPHPLTEKEYFKPKGPVCKICLDFGIFLLVKSEHTANKYMNTSV